MEQKLGWRLQLAVFGVAFLLVISHRPDSVLNAQFYAEDGAVWFGQAYNFGWLHALLLPQNGYFQTFPRLAASLGLLLPLRWVPLAMNLIGITVQVLPVTLLLSLRLARWAPLWQRAVWALVYIALPNVMELEATVTEGQWHLALLSCLVVLAEPAITPWWWAFDVGILLVGGLTGPFCLILLPVAVLSWWLRRQRTRLVPIVMLTAASLVQLPAVLSTAAASRSPAPLGATPKLFLQLLAGRVYMATLWGSYSLQAQTSFLLLIVMAVVGTAIIVYCLSKAELELRLLVAFCFAVFALSMSHPMASYVEPQWKVLSTAAGQHYWFLPMLAFSWCLVWASWNAASSGIRKAAALLLFTMLLGVMQDWRYPAYEDMQYSKYTRRFALAETGGSVLFPLFPRGWEMRLTKRSDACPIYAEGMIDSPKSNALVGGPFSVWGWAVIAGRPVQKVLLKVDCRLLASSPARVRRPDVDQVYSNSPDVNKGWQTEVDFSHFPPGLHTLSVWTFVEPGCTTEAADITFERAP